MASNTPISEAVTPVDGATAPVATDAPDASLDFPAAIEGATEGEVWELARPGDSWDVIAERNSTTAETLCALNADQPHFSERSVQVNTLVRVR